MRKQMWGKMIIHIQLADTKHIDNLVEILQNSDLGKVYFSDHEKLYMDGACFNMDVESALDNLKSGDKAELLLHPNSDYIWEMKCDETVILSFEDAKTRIRSENIAFSAILGAFGYLCAGARV